MLSVPKRDGYVRKMVARRLIEHHNAMGWEPITGKGPDGKYWIGDCCVMEIPEDRYAELTSRNREAYETARRVMEEGITPGGSENPEDGVTIRPSKPKREKLTVPVS